MPSPKKSDRRSFINTILVAGATTGLVIPVVSNPVSKSGSKVKMLTADGKLVEVDKSVIEKLGESKKASDKEVFEWMDEKHKT